MAWCLGVLKHPQKFLQHPQSTSINAPTWTMHIALHNSINPPWIDANLQIKVSKQGLAVQGYSGLESQVLIGFF